MRLWLKLSKKSEILKDGFGRALHLGDGQQRPEEKKKKKETMEYPNFSSLNVES